MPEQAEAGALSRLTEWVSDVEAGHNTVGADPLTVAILRRRAADTLTILADLARMKAALEGAVRLYETAKRSADNQRAFIDVRDLEAFTSDARLALRQHEDG